MPKPSHDPDEMFEEFLFDFDQEDLGRFVRRLPNLIESGFGKTQADQVTKAVKKLRKGVKSTLDFPIRYVGQETRLVVSLHAMDDVEFPTLYLYGTPDLIAAVEDELSRFVEQSPDEEG
ncbi:MAG: hypothetical protein JNN07_19610 [Verrucomicrobiales bacterium]|nr:hypothetical protein [Verrucomicrobiales bacterium]